MCEWFLNCQNEAIGMTPHPVLGAVPICWRCASRFALKVERFPEPKACEATGGHHSEDLVLVYHGSTTPSVLCGKHAQQQYG
jgi:hypothetical protein